MVRNEYGRNVLLTADDANTIFLIGDGASPEGDRPFLDTFDTHHKETNRLFRSEAPHYERPVLVMNKEARRVITRRESVDDVPNYYVRDLADGTLRQLTFFPHPTPELKGIQKELIRYKREDGLDLTATLYTPSGYDPEADGPLYAIRQLLAALRRHHNRAHGRVGILVEVQVGIGPTDNEAEEVAHGMGHLSGHLSQGPELL